MFNEPTIQTEPTAHTPAFTYGFNYATFLVNRYNFQPSVAGLLYPVLYRYQRRFKGTDTTSVTKPQLDELYQGVCSSVFSCYSHRYTPPSPQFLLKMLQLYYTVEATMQSVESGLKRYELIYLVIGECEGVHGTSVVQGMVKVITEWVCYIYERKLDEEFEMNYTEIP